MDLKKDHWGVNGHDGPLERRHSLQIQMLEQEVRSTNSRSVAPSRQWVYSSNRRARCWQGITPTGSPVAELPMAVSPHLQGSGCQTALIALISTITPSGLNKSTTGTRRHDGPGCQPREAYSAPAGRFIPPAGSLQKQTNKFSLEYRTGNSLQLSVSHWLGHSFRPAR